MTTMENDNNVSSSKQTFGTVISSNIERTSASVNSNVNTFSHANTYANTDINRREGENNKNMNNRSANDSSVEISPEENLIESGVSPRSVQMLMASSESQVIPSASTTSPATSSATSISPRPITSQLHSTELSTDHDDHLSENQQAATTMTMATNEQQQQQQQQQEITHDNIMDQTNISLPFLPISCGTITTTETTHNDTNVDAHSNTGIVSNNLVKTMPFITPQSFLDGNQMLNSNLSLNSNHRHPYLHPKQIIERHNSNEWNDNENGDNNYNKDNIILPFQASSTNQQKGKNTVEIGSTSHMVSSSISTHTPNTQGCTVSKSMCTTQKASTSSLPLPSTSTSRLITEESMLPFALPGDMTNTNMDGCSSRNFNSLLEDGNFDIVHDDIDCHPSTRLHDHFMSDHTIGNQCKNDNHGGGSQNISSTQTSLLDFKSSLHDNKNNNEDGFVMGQGGSGIPEISSTNQNDEQY